MTWLVAAIEGRPNCRCLSARHRECQGQRVAYALAHRNFCADAAADMMQWSVVSSYLAMEICITDERKDEDGMWILHSGRSEVTCQGKWAWVVPARSSITDHASITGDF